MDGWIMDERTKEDVRMLSERPTLSTKVEAPSSEFLGGDC